ACIGDSITYGAGIKQRKINSFPAQLGTMLGKGYEVKNFGVSASTLLKKGNKPYWSLPQFEAAQDYQPDIVIIKLGTNDTKASNWKHKAEFKANYCEMIRVFQSLESKPDVLISYPAPVFPEGERWKWGIKDTTVKEEIIPLINEIAKMTSTNVIDLYKPLAGKPELLPDNVHPNAAGAKVIAETIFLAISKET
ncbi:MAG: GDSL-type esterase/lipase family protein, partial [Verrucomicrobiales bacterium]|nr:GDSL-type esterase/lipase family protein [Verrucomicrobiales bacterium]